MPKRFGRTQKRKLRESLETANKTIRIIEDDLRFIRKKNNQAEHAYKTLADAILTITDNFIGMKPQIIERDFHHEYLKMWPREKLKSIPYDSHIAAITAHEILLHAVYVMAEYKEIQRYMHIGVKTNKGGIAYYISDEALLSGQHEYLLRHVMEIIREALPKAIREAKKR